MEDFISGLRALLLQFERSPLTDLHFRKGEWTVFLARPGGAANPMLTAEEGAEQAAQPTSAPSTVLRAPHLGLFEPACAAGDRVGAGDLLGAIDVLGRRTELRAAAAGRIGGVLVVANDLVEYGEALLELETAA